MNELSMLVLFNAQQFKILHSYSQSKCMMFTISNGIKPFLFPPVNYVSSSESAARGKKSIPLHSKACEHFILKS